MVQTHLQFVVKLTQYCLVLGMLLKAALMPSFRMVAFPIAHWELRDYEIYYHDGYTRAWRGIGFK